MREPHARTAHIQARTNLDDLLSMLSEIAPLASKRAEALALYTFMSAFWGVLLYAAFQYALP